jgi:hypothetical protein
MKELIIKIIMFISAFIIAPIIFIIGLISPLTPSEGLPSIIGLLIFWIFPLIILGVVIYHSKIVLIKIIIGIEFLIIFGFEIYLLINQIY